MKADKQRVRKSFIHSQSTTRDRIFRSRILGCSPMARPDRSRSRVGFAAELIKEDTTHPTHPSRLTRLPGDAMPYSQEWLRMMQVSLTALLIC